MSEAIDSRTLTESPAVQEALHKLYLNFRNRAYLDRELGRAILMDLARAERLDEARWWHNREVTIQHNCEQEIGLQAKGYLRFARGCERVVSLIREIKWVYPKPTPNTQP